MYYLIVYYILWRMSTEKHKKKRGKVLIFLTFLTAYLFQSIIWLLYFSSNSGDSSTFSGHFRCSLLKPEFDKKKASPEGPEMPKYKVNWRKAKEIRNAQFMDNM